jgi:hypothetical protein
MTLVDEEGVFGGGDDIDDGVADGGDVVLGGHEGSRRIERSAAYSNGRRLASLNAG